ncbi:hypothetical protein JXB12_05650 [candidate division KSB1 bacterium]|nr:hypothetical protein [candidate division KSB1 bacterium]
MKRKAPNWHSYWDDYSNLNQLLKFRDNISNVYDNIRTTIGRVLMSEEMLEIQESLEERIDFLKKDKIAA